MFYYHNHSPFRGHHFDIIFVHFCNIFTEKYTLQQDLSLYLGVESKHTDNLTTTTAQIGIFV